MRVGPIQELKTPTGRVLTVAIASDGTRVVAAHFHKRELLSLTIALDGAALRMQDLGCAVEQHEFTQLRDLFLQALHHEAR